MKGYGLMAVMFSAGIGLAVGQHETSFWLIIGKALIWPSVAGYQFAMAIFHYS